jgi:hypothetical protein
MIEMERMVGGGRERVERKKVERDRTETEKGRQRE